MHDSSVTQPSNDTISARATLTAAAASFGIVLDERMQTLFHLYHELLSMWGTRFNLLGPAAMKRIWEDHFLDAILLVIALPHGIDDTAEPLQVLDVGTGAGFPGIPLAISFPAWNFTLLDATGKKIQFLDMVVHELRLHNVRVIQGRAEDLAHDHRHREAYDAAVARAVAPTASLLELALPFVLKNGYAFFYKSISQLDAELSSAEAARALLGADPPTVFPTKRTPEDGRCLVRYKKVHRSPHQLPRRSGLPVQRPLTAEDQDLLSSPRTSESGRNKYLR